jgi:tRNA(Glu) U13 pseudouridine synthase TruD
VYGLNWPTTTILSGEQLNKEKITHEVKSAKGNKFWIVVTGTSQSSEQSQESKPLNERDLFINFFNQNFNKIKEYKSIGVYTALYEI